MKHPSRATKPGDRRDLSPTLRTARKGDKQRFIFINHNDDN